MSDAYKAAVVKAVQDLVADIDVAEVARTMNTPHVAGTFDPDTDPTDMSAYVNNVVGPFPDATSAMAAAFASADELNANNNGDIDWVPFVLPIYPPSDVLPAAVEAPEPDETVTVTDLIGMLATLPTDTRILAWNSADDWLPVRDLDDIAGFLPGIGQDRSRLIFG